MSALDDIRVTLEDMGLKVRGGYERQCWEYDNEDDFPGVEIAQEEVRYPEDWKRVLVVCLYD